MHDPQVPETLEGWSVLHQMFRIRWPEWRRMAGSDRKVLATCCAIAGLRAPAPPFLCTVKLSRRTWRLRSCRLPSVCAHLGLPQRQHRAAADAEARARIVIAAMRSVAEPASLFG